MLKNVGCSFCVGHKQTLEVAIQPVLDGTMRLGIVAGASYLFDEPYKDAGFGNSHFRGVVMLHDAKDGFADPSFTNQEIAWKAERDLATMMVDTWRWQQQNPTGYDA